MNLLKKIFGNSRNTALVVAATLLALAIALQNLLERQPQKYPLIGRDPVFQLLYDKSKEFKEITTLADESLKKSNSEDVLLSYEKFTEMQSLFADTIFNQKHYDDLVKNGFYIEKSEIDSLKYMKSKYDEMITKLQEEVQKIQKEERLKHNSEQSRLRHL